MATSYLDRGAGRIAYDVQGTGPLVICLHGMGDLRSVYRFTVPALVEAGYRVATMDLRGHGDSDDTFSAFDDVAAGTDAIALIEHLASQERLGGGERALLVGNSMGAGAAVWAAAERPDLVAGMALMGPFVRNPATNPLQLLMFRVLLAKPWGPAAWRSYYPRYYPGRPPADLDQHIERIRTSMRHGRHWRSFVRTTRTDHTPARDRLSRVKAPVLVVMGTKDLDWPDPTAEARFVADSLGGELLLVPNAGHYPMTEYPELVNPALVAFARRALSGA
jgi:pimeloyl-ACP methyl ester carboxylesterase